MQNWTDLSLCFFSKRDPKASFWSFHQDHVNDTSRALPSAFFLFSYFWWCVSPVHFAPIRHWEPLSSLCLHYHHTRRGKPCDWMNQYCMWPNSREVDLISTSHHWHDIFPLLGQIYPKLSLSNGWDSEHVVTVFSGTQKMELIQLLRASVALSGKIARAGPNRGKKGEKLSFGLQTVKAIGPHQHDA